jgi:hypothetical protein
MSNIIVANVDLKRALGHEWGPPQKAEDNKCGWAMPKIDGATTDGLKSLDRGKN